MNLTDMRPLEQFLLAHQCVNAPNSIPVHLAASSVHIYITAPPASASVAVAPSPTTTTTSRSITYTGFNAGTMTKGKANTVPAVTNILHLSRVPATIAHGYTWFDIAVGRIFRFFALVGR